MCVLLSDRKFLEEEFILRVMAQLSLALKECHSRNVGGSVVLHRDLKPANIFLDAKQNVKLGDFGLARILKHDTSFAKTFVGTPYYMSPVSKALWSFPNHNNQSINFSFCALFKIAGILNKLSQHVVCEE